MKSLASGYDAVHTFIEDLAGDVLHPKQVDSLAHAVTGALHADLPSIHAIGRAAARVRAVSEEHSIKQVDRLLANSKVDPLEVMRHAVPILIAERSPIVVAVDWTEFASSGHSTLAISMLVEQGRATPLVWTTVAGKQTKKRRSQYEDRLLRSLRVAVPEDVHVSVLADRGLADEKNPRFGLALDDTLLGTPGRRDRMLLVLALAAMFDVLVEAAGGPGQDGPPRENAEPRERTRSLPHQGLAHKAGVARAATEVVTQTFKCAGAT